MIDPLEHFKLFRPYDGPVITLPGVTSITADDRCDTDTIRRMASITLWHRRFIKFGRELILSGARPDVDGIDWVKMDKWGRHYMSAYSQWCQYELRNQFTTPHALIWQTDGFALNPESWSDEFLGYDYIGSVWDWGCGRVGNGGFSLRSRKFCEEVSTLENCGDVPEDYYFCITKHDELAERGVRFAPSRIGVKWGTQCGRYDVKDGRSSHFRHS